MGWAEAQIAVLRARGVLPHDLLEVGHFFSHFHAPARELEAFRVALRRAGFGNRDRRIGTCNEACDDTYWHHWAYTIEKAAAHRLKRLDTLARDLSQQHGVRYDGWCVARLYDRMPLI